MADRDMLAALPLFNGLTAEQLATIAAHFHRRVALAGTTLMMAEQTGEAVYLIQRGTVKISVDQTDGSEVILSLRGPGDLIGEMSLIDQRGRSANVVTLEECILWWTDRSVFGAWLQSMPALPMNLLRLLSSRLRLANAQIMTLATLDVNGRVARQILTFADEYGQPADDQTILIPLRLTQSDLAGMIGASRVRVNEVIGALKRQGLISVDTGHRITVLSPVRLARLCEPFQLP